MNSVIGKKRVSFEINTDETLIYKKLYSKIETVFHPIPENPVRVRSDSGNEMHIKKYIGIINIKN